MEWIEWREHGFDFGGFLHYLYTEKSLAYIIEVLPNVDGALP